MPTPLPAPGDCFAKRLLASPWTHLRHTLRTVLTLPLLAAVAVGTFSSGCRKSGAEEHVQRADAYFKEARYPESIIEYRSAVQIEPRRGELRVRLGDAYLRSNDRAAALREYVRAADLLPDAEVQLQAGALLLGAGSYEDAKTRADKVLAADPNNVNAQILRGNALAGLKDLNGAIAEYEDALALDPSQNQAYVNLATLQLAAGKQAEAEATFRKTVELAPRSIDARIALANFYRATKRQPESESELKAALAIDPKNAEANRALGVFYMATGRGAEAEPYLRTMAVSGEVSSKLTLSAYYLLMRREEEARVILEEVAKDKRAGDVATLRLAALDASQGRRAEAQGRIHDVLTRNPKDVSAHLLNADLLRRDRRRDEALAEVDAAIAIDPNSARAHLMAGRLYAEADRTAAAVREYQEVLKLDPAPIGADLELARLYLNSGELDKAATYVQQALTLSPGNVEAHALLTRVYVRRGDLAKARAELATLQQSFPRAAAGFNLAALIQLEEKQPAAARASYVHALQLSPGDLEALGGVLNIDIAAGRKKEVAERLEAVLARQNPTSEILLMAARSYAGIGNDEKYEEMLRRSIEVDPGRLQGYGLLGRLYARQKRTGEAKRQFADVLKREPKSVSASTMLGTLIYAEGNVAEAEKQFEQTLAIDSRAAAAANNLAYIYLSTDRNLDQALQLARTAVEQMPDDPHVNDTVGWAYVKKNMASSGIPYLESSARKTPDDPVAQYHLGAAYMASGDVAKAEAQMKRALALKSDFEGADDARKALRALGG